MGTYNPTAHSTIDEINFLTNIGTHTERPTNGPTAKELLIGYINASSIRSNWGSINRSEVMKHAYALLGSANRATP